MSSQPVQYADDIVKSLAARRTLAFGRIALGFLFLWAFLDKTFGLGFSTSPEKSWLHGGTPAQSYLGYATKGTPFEGFFSLFTNPVGDFLFMMALLGLGVALILGIGLRVSAVAGTALLFMMYLSEFPPFTEGATNPIVDQHWIYAVALLAVCFTRAGDTWGLGRWWAGLVGNSWLR